MSKLNQFLDWFGNKCEKLLGCVCCFEDRQHFSAYDEI
tara:strand:- start:413 stop:526 length:114 start_codon:yes stop_codon:yes gene_type:complete